MTTVTLSEIENNIPKYLEMDAFGIRQKVWRLTDEVAEKHRDAAGG